MYLKTLNLGDIHPYERNPRINDNAVEPVMKSIQKDGYRARIIVDNDGVIIAGHTRYEAMKRLGWTEAEVWIADDMTPEQIADYRIRDNLTADFAEWDFSELEAEIQELDLDFDMSEFEGFEDTQGGVSDTEPAAEEDDFDVDAPVEAKAKRGDIYRLGRHRLMCGDSTNLADVDALMDGAGVDMIYTDPPYGMNLDTDFSSMKNHLDFALEKGFVGGKKYEQGIVDDFTPEMLDTVFAIKAAEVFLWGADYYAELLLGRNDGSWIVWDKRANGNDDIAEDYQSDKMYGSCFELCWSKKRHKRDIARVKWAGVFGTEQEPDKKRFHPTQKPVGLSRWFIDRFSTEGQTILDLFGGSGSTLIACEQAGRKCYMMELDPHYVDVIIARWENLTGEKAVLLNG